MSEGIQKIVSGGQTGADRAALDAAIERGVPHGGWIPQGRRAEDGRISDSYAALREANSGDYAVRTELNVRDSDGTIIVSHGPLTGGSKLTQELCRKNRKPCLHIDLDKLDEDAALSKLKLWLDSNGVRVLNVAGPRASGDPAIYGAVKRLFCSALGARA